MPGVPSKSAETTAPPGRLFQVPLDWLTWPPVLAQPGTRKAKLMTLRPLTGRLSTCLVSMVLAKTGSRGAFVSVCVLLLIVFWNASPPGKLALVVGCFLAIGLGTFLLPKSLLNRYVTMATKEAPVAYDEWESGADNTLRDSAVGLHHQCGIDRGQALGAYSKRTNDAQTSSLRRRPRQFSSSSV